VLRLRRGRLPVGRVVREIRTQAAIRQSVTDKI